MLNFDEETIKKLRSPKVTISDKLYVIARYIEEEYQFVAQPNYWDDVFDSFKPEDKIFYKTWLWICYGEWETLVAPIREFDDVFGTEERDKLLRYLKNKNNHLEDLESYYTLDGEAGETLLKWGLEKLETTYKRL